MRVVEVRRDGDDRLLDRRAEITFGVALELTQDEGGNFRRGVIFICELDAQHFARLQVFGDTEREQLQLFLDVLDAATHQPLNRVDRALRGLDQVLARRVADNDLAARIERHQRGDEVRPIFAGDDLGRAVCPHERHQRVRGSEIDSDDAFFAAMKIQISH